MKNQFDLSHNIIEFLLFALDNPPEAGMDMDALFENYHSSELEIILRTRDVHTAFQLKKLMDSMPGGCFIYYADGDEEIVYANESILRIFGCKNMAEFRELTGNSFRGLVHPDDLDEVERSIKEQIAHSRYDLDHVEYRIIRKDGQVRWLDDYGHFVHSETSGDIFYVFAGDVTEKKEREAAEKRAFLAETGKRELQLKEQIREYSQELKLINQEHLRRLEVIAGLSIDYESIFYVDLDTNKIKAYRVSTRFEKQFMEDEVLDFAGFDAAYIRNWVYPEDRDILCGVSEPDYIRERLSNDKSFHLNYRVFENGRTKYIQLRIVNVGPKDRISQIVLGYRNIDDEIIQEMKQSKMLKEALRAANSANNAKNLFLSNMSHDIRTPMNGIVGFAALARKHIEERARVENYLDQIQASSDQLMQLLNDVLEIARLESGKIHMEENDCSLMDITHQVQMDMLPRATASGHTISLDISNLTHDNVIADRDRIKQILAYLVDNAIKYTPKGGRISLVVSERHECRHGSACYQFVVEDNGMGISEDFLDHLFEPFEREKNTTLSGIHGTGLGLTVAKYLVELMGGKIDVSSKPGKGSRFSVTIPFRIQKQKVIFQTGVDSGDGGERKSERTKRILIVDDNEINLEIENEVLKDAGFLVETASDGSEAVKMVNQSQPGYYDLILMDIQMPVMDGYNATRAIRSIENSALSGIPIIAVSANAFEEDRRKAMESGMDEHLAKPLDTTRLFQLLNKFLRIK